MRDPYGEIVGYGVATLDSELFAREGIVDVSNYRSSAAPDKAWLPPPGHVLVIETFGGDILSDAVLRRQLRHNARWRLVHGGAATCLGVFMLTAGWPTAPFVVAGIIIASIGVYGLATLDSRGRSR
jgi:hypothetical protein